MTVIMHDIDLKLTEEEKTVLKTGELHKEICKYILYADDTILFAKTSQAVELLLHKIQDESGKYNMALNEDKCIHIPLNAIHDIQFLSGKTVPKADRATYLGGIITKSGDHRPEIKSRIANTWITVKKLDLLWKSKSATRKWKLRVFEAVIVAKLLYGLETIPITDADARRIDAFQVRGLRKY